ncbi:oxygenase MpaB family protein [Allopontixanthobacter sp.]|uniref:oxygenase MpaB family protein n=1 Tax=Allopontixanthobacter sp. TaxID=2906452 RepID=UPI002AB800F9|nr:oxygenase MpaB family protein [Allopontixanthobacter sp.]MDZ4308345.1 oxygenase MpaB family protein [Allopontixanthobacter sp.]
MVLARPSEKIRERLVGRIRALFNDVEGGQQPVPPSDNALFERDSPIRLVHADIVSMMVGGVRGLLLQMLHPHALQGVLDHSDFRSDMHGRLRRTARFIAVTTFGEAGEAEKTIARVNRIHQQVAGTLPDGTAYSATNPQTLAWVHLAEATSFLEGYLRYARSSMPYAQQDEYFRQFAVIARKLGADPVPESRAEAEHMLRDMRPQLRSSPEAKDIARLVLSQRPQGTPPAVQQLLGTAAVDLLPPYARSMLGLQSPGLGALPARAAAQTMGTALRWAFRQ